MGRAFPWQGNGSRVVEELGFSCSCQTENYPKPCGYNVSLAMMIMIRKGEKRELEREGK